MGIKVTSSFDEQASLPLDSREVQLNQTNRDAIPSSVRYEGMVVYVIDDKLTYQLVNGITNADWVEFGSSVSIIDNLTSTSSGDALSANMGRELQDIKQDNLPLGNADDILSLDTDGVTPKWVPTTRAVILWFPNITYSINDVISHDGILYKAINTSTNKRPDISPLEWKEATVNEAPVDGKTYWRKDEDWVDTTDYGGF